MSVRRLSPNQPDSFAFTPATLKAAQGWMASFPAGRQQSAMVPILWLSVILVILPDLTWGTWGFAQFGYRRILDVLPLVLLLLGIVFRERIGWFPRATVLVGVVVHAYAIFVWNVLGFVA